MKNFWIDRAMAIIETEILLVKQSAKTKKWFDLMPAKIPVICPEVKKLTRPEHFLPQIGNVHHIRLTKLGIEAVLKIPKKYRKYSLYVLYDNNIKPNEPFWVVLH